MRCARSTWAWCPASIANGSGVRRCGFIAYVNPRLVVTTLPVTDAGELVLLRRAIEPAYGSWAQPGGFLEADETAIQGAVRETLEETGLEVVPTAIVGIYSQPQAVGRRGRVRGAHRGWGGAATPTRRSRSARSRPTRSRGRVDRARHDPLGAPRLGHHARHRATRRLIANEG